MLPFACGRKIMHLTSMTRMCQNERHMNIFEDVALLFSFQYIEFICFFFPVFSLDFQVHSFFSVGVCFFWIINVCFSFV